MNAAYVMVIIRAVLTVQANQMAVLTWIIVMNVLVVQQAQKHVFGIVWALGVVLMKK